MVLSVLELTMDAGKAGLIAATIHHFTVQCPNQSGIFTTIYVFSLINSIYLGLILFLGTTDAILPQGVGRLIKEFFVFNFVYVRT